MAADSDCPHYLYHSSPLLQVFLLILIRLFLTLFHQILVQAQKDYEEGMIADIPTYEMENWQAAWEESCKRLNQWDLLNEYGKANSRFDIIQNASWRLGEWVRSLSSVLGGD